MEAVRIKVTDEQLGMILERLGPFEDLATTNQYEKRRLRNSAGLVLVHYTTGKVSIQGNPTAQAPAKRVLSELGLEDGFARHSGVWVGSDECLKGDTFGGLVVAAVRVDDSARERLMQLGLKDSKKISDSRIAELAGKIYEVLGSENIRYRTLYPEDYNKIPDVTWLLDRMHKACGEDFSVSGRHIVDKYPGCSAGDVRETRAESKYVEVAAASIIARDYGLKQFKELGEIYGVPVPKGSTHVEQALRSAMDSGIPMEKLVKMNFRNVEALAGRWHDVREHKGMKYYQGKDGLWRVIIEASSRDGRGMLHEFLIGQDDSKMAGIRRFIERANTEESAKAYIDWYVEASREITIECPDCGRLLFKGPEIEAKGLIIYSEECAMKDSDA